MPSRLCCLIALVIAPAAAQDRVRDSRAYFPLEVGQKWTMRLTDSATKGATDWHHEVLGQAEVEGGKCWEIKKHAGKTTSWEYVSVRDDGVYGHARSYLGSWRGVNRRSKPEPHLRFPIEKRQSWRWETIGAMQTMGGGKVRRPRETPKIHHEAVVESIADPVTVPDGIFKAVRVKHTTKSKTFGSSEETVWFARGRGVVKRQRRSSGSDSCFTYELVRWSAGATPSVADPSLAIERFLWKEPGKGPPRAQTRIDVVDHRSLRWFKSRFCRIATRKSREGPDECSFVRVRGDEVTPFDFRTLAAWEALLKDEKLALDAGDFLGNADQIMRDIAGACAHLTGLSHGSGAKFKRRGMGLSQQVNTKRTTAETKVTGTDAGGKEFTERIRVVFVGPALHEVTVRPEK